MITEDLIKSQHPDTEEKEEKPLARVLQLQPILYKPDDAAVVLGVSRSSFDRYVAPHVPRCYPGGSLVRYLHTDLVQFATGARVELPPM